MRLADHGQEAGFPPPARLLKKVPARPKAFGAQALSLQPCAWGPLLKNHQVTLSS